MDAVIPIDDTVLSNNAQEISDSALIWILKTLSDFNDESNDFFERLREMFGFYVASINLYQIFIDKCCICFPKFTKKDGYSFINLKDSCLILKNGIDVVGNSISNNTKKSCIITGFNQGGKTTFLRSIGLAQLMAQSGMFITADSLECNIYNGVYSHFPNEEDNTLEKGLLGQELCNLNELVKHMKQGCLLLMNWVNKGGFNEDKWGLVNLKGKVILPFEYESPNCGSRWEMEKGGYALVEKNGRWGMVDTQGKEILPCQYRSIIETGEDYLSLCDDSHKYGVFSLSTRKIMIPCVYPSNIDMKDSIAGSVPVSPQKSLYVLVDDKGKEITPAYLYINTPQRGLFYNSNQDRVGPDGKIVFPRNANLSTYQGKHVLIGEDLTLVIKDGKVGYINAARLAREGEKLPTTPLVKPEPIESLNNVKKYYLVNYPDKLVYKIGEAFDLEGFIAHSEDIDGIRQVLDQSKISFMVSGKVKITDGYKFTSAADKVMECYYDGVKTGFSITVRVLDPAVVGDLLDNGTYTISVNGKYLKIVDGYVELWDTEPAQTFTVKLVNYSADRGPMYYVMVDDQYVIQPSSSNGAQLVTSRIATPWRINKYKSFCTMRDYGNQKLLVNASGANSSNGTKITIWSYTGSAPEHGKFVFTPVK